MPAEAIGAAEPKLVYLLWMRIFGRDRYLLWSSEEEDGRGVDRVEVVADRVVAFETANTARQYAAEHGFQVADEEPVMHDLDAARDWANAPCAPLEVDLVLAIWNLADDVRRSLGKEIDLSGPSHTLYNKLFESADIPCLEPYRPPEPPHWDEEDLEELRQVIREAIRCVEEGLLPAWPEAGR